MLDIEFELNLTNKSNQTQTFGLFNEISQTLFIGLVRIQAKLECFTFVIEPNLNIHWSIELRLLLLLLLLLLFGSF